MARLRRQAITVGPAPVRTREVSSAKVTSRTWCSAWVDPAHGRVRFLAWYEEWWATTLNLRPKTRTRNEMVFRLYVLPRFGAAPLDAITQREVRAWVTSLTFRGLAPATVHKAYQLFAKSMAAAVDGGMLAQSPCRGVALPRVEHEEMRYLNPVEIACLAEAIRPGYQALVFVGAYGGLRMASWPDCVGAASTWTPAPWMWPRRSWRSRAGCCSGRPRPGPAAAGSGFRAAWSTSWPYTCEHQAARPTRCSAPRPAGRCG
jgi:Phage integrase, N-terminal SAM-like domain